jgi:hypothetical protein
MPKAGDILFHQEWVFNDGTLGRKLLVILNTPDNPDIPCLVLKTTSQDDRYIGAVSGCNVSKKVFLVLSANEPCFDCNTYIQLPQIWELTTEDLLSGCFSKIIKPLADPISKSCFDRIKICLKNYKDDISLKHWKLIYS